MRRGVFVLCMLYHHQVHPGSLQKLLLAGERRERTFACSQDKKEDHHKREGFSQVHRKLMILYSASSSSNFEGSISSSSYLRRVDRQEFIQLVVTHLKQL